MSKKKRTRKPPAAPKAAARSGAASAAVLVPEPTIEAAPAAEAPAEALPSPAAELIQAAIEAAPDAAFEAEALEAAPGLLDAGAATTGDHAQDTTADAPAVPAATPGQLPSALPSWTMLESGDIRGVLIQVAGGRLLLPNATIAEVLSYAEPEPDDVSADWLLGRFRWRGWHLPLVAFSQLAGIGREKPGLGSKVIVLKALGGDRRIPFFAVLTQGFPRLVSVARSALEVEAGEAGTGVLARVRLNEEPALLPDLAGIEECLRSLRQAA